MKKLMSIGDRVVFTGDFTRTGPTLFILLDAEYTSAQVRSQRLRDGRICAFLPDTNELDVMTFAGQLFRMKDWRNL